MKQFWVVCAAFAVTACGQKVADTAQESDVQQVAANDVSTQDLADTATEEVLPQVWQTNPDHAPRSVHLTWQHDPATTVTVQWATTALELGGYEPHVWFASVATAGADGAKIPFDAKATATGGGEVYYQALAEPLPDDPHWVEWTVELTGLQPNTEYVYRAGSWESLSTKGFTGADLSDVLRFRTAPLKGTRAPFTSVLAGDSRGAVALIKENATRLAQIDAAMWVFNGDFCTSGLQPDWDEWFDAMSPILSGRVLMPVQGNHEFFPPMFYGQFALPVTPGVPADYKEHAWSFNYANVHYVGLDSMQDSSVMDLVPWLDSDLQVAREDPDVDWIIVMMHHPAFSSSNHGSTERVQKYWSPVFDKYDVDLVFSGHDHNYERTVPIRGGKQVDKGPIYVVAGSFFVDAPYGNGKDWWTKTSTDGKVYNYVKLDVDGKKLSWTAFSGDGKTVLDSETLQK
jgi:hypothetical protein